MDDVKFCRRCGGKPELIRVGDMKQLYVYRCKSCLFMPAKSDEAKPTERAARRIWNKGN